MAGLFWCIDRPSARPRRGATSASERTSTSAQGILVVLLSAPTILRRRKEHELLKTATSQVAQER